MNAITILGIVSVFFVAAWTCYAYQASPGHGQSPRSAITEAWLNILVGFSFNFVLNILVIPLAMEGGHMTLANNWWMGWVFTAASIVRQYAIRRWFNARLVRLAHRLAGEQA